MEIWTWYCNRIIRRNSLFLMELTIKMHTRLHLANVIVHKAQNVPSLCTRKGNTLLVKYILLIFSKIFTTTINQR